MSITVKHFHSAMTGAPVLSGTAGALIAVLDACLVNGFGTTSVTSLTVASGVATANFASGHPFMVDAIALFSGATPAALNGEKRILSTTTNTVTFDATGVADGAATGTISAKLAAAGWGKTYAGTNLAVYRSDDVTGTRLYLRVDDTGATNARVVGYEGMTDVNTGTGPFPTSTQLTGGGYWPKASAANATGRSWTVIADGKTFFLHISTQTTTPGVAGCVWGFGDFTSYKSGDAYACTLQAAASDLSTSTAAASAAAEYGQVGGGSGVYLPRSFTALGGSVAALHAVESYWGTTGVLGAVAQGLAPAYPNGPNNGLLLSRKLVLEPGVALRGVQRGLLTPAQNCHAVFGWRDKVAGQGDYAGRTLLAVKAGAPAGTVSAGLVFFDITGPWG